METAESKYDYRKFLQRFTFPREEVELDTESFDYIFYNFGMEQYGSMPLIEPLEYKEVRRLEELFRRVRERIPGVVLRTSLIAGLPYEDDAAFEELCDFLREVRIERAGVFPFSPEDGTKAALMEHVDMEEAQRRAELAVDVQSDIIDAYNDSILGEEREVLCEGYDSQAQMFYGRSYAESPDIDGRIWFTADSEITPGSFVNVRLTGTMDGETTGELV